MDNKDFDKIFADKLSQTQEFDYSDSDWQEVAEQLKDKRRKKRGVFWWWTGGLVILALAGTCIGLTIHLHKTKKELKQVQQAMLSANQNKEAISTTTVVKSEENTTEQSTAAFPNNNKAEATIDNKTSVASPNNNATTYTTSTRTSEPPVTYVAPVSTQQSSNENSTTELELLNNQSQELSPITKTTKIVIAELPKKANIDPITLNSLSQLLSPLEFVVTDEYDKPTNPIVRKKKSGKFAIGLTTGWALPNKLAPASRTDMSAAVASRSAWDLGLRGSYQLNHNFEIWGSATFHSSHYRSKNNPVSSVYDTNANANADGSFDPISIYNGNVLVSEADENSSYQFKIRQNTLRYRLGINYHFLTKRKWSPFVGLSLQAQSTLRQKIIYPGTNWPAQNDSELKISSSQLKSVGIDSGFQIYSGAVLAGLKVNLNSKWTWQNEAWYQPIFNSNPGQLYDSFGVNSTFSFHF